MIVTLRIDGSTYVADDVPFAASLLNVLRDHLGLRGPKDGCGEGECGACSVLIDGALVCACLVLAATVIGRDIRTAADEGAEAVRSAFIDAGAIQCGYCTPGMVSAGLAASCATDPPSELDLREAIVGNLCRCTGYGRVLEALRADATDAGKR